VARMLRRLKVCIFVSFYWTLQKQAALFKTANGEAGRVRLVTAMRGRASQG
jgi:hypothetical protein